jgi:hypothetical protein
MFSQENTSRHYYLFIFSSILILFFTSQVYATLPRVTEKIVADSQNLISLRIYSYDMKIDSKGNVHIIYSKPIDGTNSAEIWYVRRIDGTWFQQRLNSKGFRFSGSTFLAIGNDDLVHACYIYNNNNGGDLHYLTINQGIPSSAIGTFVSPGGFHTRMQLDENDHAMFVRAAQPGGIWRLRLHTTTNNRDWTYTDLNLPQVPKFRLADFVYEDSRYHITYGDTAYKKEVWKNKNMDERVVRDFHDFHYVTSTDGVNWSHHLIDNSHTLMEYEFWTALKLVQGRPLIGMYKYSEYGGKYNRGTSAKLSELTENGWTHKTITNQDHPDTSEGMGIALAVNGPGDYFGAWDFSPDNTYDDEFRGPRGNIALSRSGTDGKWSYRRQLDPFSLEGRAKLSLYKGRLFFLGLGDFVDAKLFFREYQISSFTDTPPATGTGKPLTAIYHLLLNR